MANKNAIGVAANVNILNILRYEITFLNLINGIVDTKIINNKINVLDIIPKKIPDEITLNLRTPITSSKESS